ncbi:hypothetical protein F2P81_005434 [Scophthalmus maximus]|uniref:Uncharacterized protein n=1 Tax=Scophthalmus maximus TaxID=52904 RepID=A0A6A4TIM7_SCOMX|nr:hypothetical protein F2P81_005434 [Scophthalmus maximus]
MTLIAAVTVLHNESPIGVGAGGVFEITLTFLLESQTLTLQFGFSRIWSPKGKIINPHNWSQMRGVQLEHEETHFAVCRSVRRSQVQKTAFRTPDDATGVQLEPG